jgi:hypothetical protein
LRRAPARADARDVRLLEAVKRRDQKAFDALMQAKADVNGAQPDGATALAWRCSRRTAHGGGARRGRRRCQRQR